MGEKRVSTDLGDAYDPAPKPVKMRNLESVVHSAETNSRFANNKENSVEWSFGDKKLSQITEVPVTKVMGASKDENGLGARVSLLPGSLDLNTEACCARYSARDKSVGYVENPTKGSLSEKLEREQRSNFVNTRGINVDLNAEDVTSSINVEPVNSHKGHGHFKSKDVSESGSCTGPLEEKDPMRIWKEMKQNGFLSSSHGGIPVPKQRGRKSKNEMLKKKMELAKREQVNRFTKIAAPSGLLNGLNPGIINHVRNRKQVHSIIEALVRSEQHENSSMGSKQAAYRTNASIEVSKRDIEYINDVGKRQLSFPHEEGTFRSSSGSRQARKSSVALDDSSSIMEAKVCDHDTCTVEKASLKSCVSNTSYVTEDDILALKLSSSMKASISSTTLSNEESSNNMMVSSLSLKAATVASQWLELLHQDIKGRLSALRRSRRRVRSVITTELPFLISKEFANNQDCDPHAMKIAAGLPTLKTADLHRARWTALFDHMDEALSEEEKQLESWLNQVKEKQLLCDQGLQHVNWSKAYGLQQLGTSENDSRSMNLELSNKVLLITEKKTIYIWLDDMLYILFTYVMDWNFCSCATYHLLHGLRMTS
ncbi:hypothetical protein SESBI_42268 [Sesbania bispinosa]|nr:hypothetical protein SESBI_42268 [Sesbania bispinosa]